MLYVTQPDARVEFKQGPPWGLNPSVQVVLYGGETEYNYCNMYSNGRWNLLTIYMCVYVSMCTRVQIFKMLKLLNVN